MTNKDFEIIVNALSGVSDLYITYDQRKTKALEELRNQALEDELKAATFSVRANAGPKIAAMLSACERIKAETKKGNDYNVNDPAVADAAKLLSNKLNPETVQNVVSKFVGNMVALELIKAAAAEDNKAIISAWIFDNVGALESISKNIGKLEWENVENFPAIISQIREGVQEFARHQGIDLGKLSDSIEEMRMRNIAALMGIDYRKLV